MSDLLSSQMLLSGRVKKTPSADVSADRYDWIKLQEVEPDLGVSTINGSILLSSTVGQREWSTSVSVDTAGNLIVSSEVVIGNINTNEYSRLRHVEGQNSGYGFSNVLDTYTVLINEEASFAQALFLGDVNSSSTGPLFGISVLDDSLSTPSTGSESWIPRLTLSGTGNLSIAGLIGVQNGIKIGNIDVFNSQAQLLSLSIKDTNSANTTTVQTAVLSENRTVVIPNISGTFVTTGDTGTVTSTMILDGTIVDGDVSATAAISDTKLGTISAANKVSLSALNIAGATDIGTDITNNDVIVLDNGGNGIIRKSNVTRIPPYVFTKITGDILVASNGVATIQPDSVALGTDTTGNYVATITGTANQVIVSGSGSETAAVILSLPQDIHSAATPTFSGMTVKGQLSMLGDAVVRNNIVNLANPINPHDAVTKLYVDELAAGLIVKKAANIFVDFNLDATYANGDDSSIGIGSTLTANLPGAFPEIDGVRLDTVGERVLVTAQTNPAHNGLYVITNPGDSGTAWVLTRCADCDEPNEIIGAFVFITQGDFYSATGWVSIADDFESFVVGEDPLIWVQFSGAGSFLPGTGLNLDGNVFNVNSNLSHVTGLGTITSGTWQGNIIDPAYGGTGVNNGNSTITLGGNFTLSGPHSTTITVTDSTSVTLPTSGTLARTQSALNQFASTTSSQFAEVINDETGTGFVVFSDTPSFTTAVTTSSASFFVFNTNASSITAFGAASTLDLANSTLQQVVTIGGGSTGASTYNFGTGATANASTKILNIGTGGAPGSTTNIAIGSNIGGTTTINSSALVGSSSTQDLFDSVATTVNFAGAATAINIGASTGTTLFRHNVSVNGNIILGTQTNKATLTYTTNAARTYTIPDVNTSNFVMTEGDQTINGAKTFSTAISVSGTSKAAGRFYAGEVNPSNTTRLNYDGVLHASGFVSGNADITTNTTNVTTTSTTLIDTTSASLFRTVKYLVQITQGSSYQSAEILIIHNGTTTFMTEYAILRNGSNLGNFSSDISDNNIRLLVTMVTSSSATIKTFKASIEG